MLSLGFETINSEQIRQAEKFQNIQNIQQEVGANKEAEDIDGAVKKFEAFFINFLLTEMRKNLPQNEIFGGNAMSMYQGMLDEQLAEEMAERGDFGLAQLAKEDLLRALEGESTNIEGQKKEIEEKIEEEA